MRRDPIRVAAEHEAAHAVVAMVLGVQVVRLEIGDDGTGVTRRARCTPERSACISVAGDLWDREHSAHEYEYNSCLDLQRAVDQVGVAGIHAARRRARTVLAANRRDVVWLADQLFDRRIINFD